MENIRITSVKFQNFKAFRNYAISLRKMNVLVGPNNSGKSTILGAFRALAAGIRKARAKSPEVYAGPDGKNSRGYHLDSDSLPISIENVHTDYADTDTSVTFRLSNGNALLLFFPKDGGCRLFAQTPTRPPQNPTSFRNAFPVSIGVIPVLGPIEHNEAILTRETVQRDIATHRASRHFRNYWYQFPEGFSEFADLVAQTWPKMMIRKAEPDISSGALAMFCEEDRISRELFWVGSGFQIWCQILTHLLRSRKDSLVIVDEPEIYLHPDIQRKLLGILRDLGPDTLLATHSTEIIAEAEPTEVVLVDRNLKAAERLKSRDGAQQAFDHLGSAQNVVHSQIARKRKIVFVEGADFRLIRWFARRANLKRLSDGLDVEAIPLGGYSAWTTVKHRLEGIQEALGKSVLCCCIFDRDFRSSEEMKEISTNLSSHVEFVHVHDRKEIENYLLVPEVLQRAFEALNRDRLIRDGIQPRPFRAIRDVLIEFTDSLKYEVIGQIAAKRQLFLRAKRSPLDDATIHSETLRAVDAKWGTLETRLELLPGKNVLADLNSRLQSETGTALTPHNIIEQFHDAEIPADLTELLKKLNKFASKSF